MIYYESYMFNDRIRYNERVNQLHSNYNVFFVTIHALAKTLNIQVALVVVI